VAPVPISSGAGQGFPGGKDICEEWLRVVARQLVSRQWGRTARVPLAELEPSLW
jgi:hypothetical protein